MTNVPNTRQFLDIIAGYSNTGTEQEKISRVPVLATVNPAHTTGRPLLTFDGESTLSTKPYPYISSYSPQAGDRVVLIPVGNSYVIQGALDRESPLNRGTSAVRDSLWGTPSTDATKAALANKKVVWFNTDEGWFESYYAATGTTGLTARGLVSGTAAGWYPVSDGPMITMVPDSSFSATSGNPVRNWGTVGTNRSRRVGGTGWFTYDNATGRITIVKAGVYRIFVKTTLEDGSGTAVFSLFAGTSGSALNVDDTFFTLSASLLGVVHAEQVGLVAAAGDVTYFYCQAGSLNVHERAGTAGYIAGNFHVQYLGPALVSN